MQIIRIMGGSEHIVPEEEAEIVAQHFGTNELMALSDGSKINTSSISEIANIPLVGFYKDYIVNKDGRTFTRDGQRITIECIENIEYLPDPKYKTIVEDNEARLQVESGNKPLILPK
jgi:hypothetical protein